MKIECANPAEVAKEAFWLAWQACGGPLGMGRLQDNAGADKESVWNCVFNKGDYPGGNAGPGTANRPGDVYGDYVFGRMMKLGIRWDEAGVTVDDHPPRGDYQSWCRKFPTYEALVRAAIASLAG